VFRLSGSSSCSPTCCCSPPSWPCAGSVPTIRVRTGCPAGAPR
jgi:hypothetical protein